MQLIRSAQMIAGEAEAVYSVSLFPGETPETFSQKLDEIMGKLGEEDTLILMDIFSGTPYNIASRQILKKNVECITGANLPMLIEAMLTRDGTPLDELAQTIAEIGKDSVKNLKPMFTQQ